MSISTSSNTVTVQAPSETITQPVTISNRPATHAREEHHKPIVPDGALKIKIEDVQDHQVKRRKEADERDDAFLKAASATKYHATIDSEMTANQPKLLPQIVQLNPLEKAPDSLRQPFIVTGHIVEHRLPQSREVRSATISSNKSTAQKISNSSTNNVVRNSRNNNLWKLSSNHVVKLETPSSTLSKTNNSSKAAIIKKEPTSRPDLVASSISALHAGNHLNQPAKSRPLLTNHHHLQSNHNQHNQFNQHSGSRGDRNANSDANKAIATTLSSQLILSSIITAAPSIKNQQLANGGSVTGLQFYVGAPPHTSSVALTKFSAGGDLTAASSNVVNLEDKPTGSKPITHSSQASKVKTCKQASAGESVHGFEKSTTLNGTANGGANVAAAARLLDLGKKLLEAAKEGKTSLVKELVVDSGAPFTSDWLDTSALHIAAKNGFSEIAEILVQAGINKDARTKLGRTALHLAAQSGSFEVADLLIRSGSDVNCRDMLKMTPLHWAVERGHASVVKRLLMANADYKVKNKFQLSPLDIAKNSGFFDIIELFKNWTSGSKDDENLSVRNNLEAALNESQDFLDIDYHLAIADSATNIRGDPMLDREEPCLDLVGLEWNKFDFAPDLFLPNSSEDEHNVGYLMKIVEELQKENQQLRQKVEQLSTADQ